MRPSLCLGCFLFTTREFHVHTIGLSYQPDQPRMNGQGTPSLPLLLRMTDDSSSGSDREENSLPEKRSSLDDGKSNVLLRFFLAYTHLCERKPILIKSLSQSIIGGLGSILSQCVIAKSSGYSSFHIDWNQVRAIMTSGLLFEGPYFHWWYER